MKKHTKIMSLLTLAAMLVLIPGANTLTVSADAPTTYNITYIDDKGEWRYTDEEDFDEGSHHSLSHIEDDIKDGDIVVIYGNDSVPGHFDFPVHLSNLTIMGAEEYVIVTTRGVTDFFALQESVAAVNGDIQNAYLYQDSRVTFNNNVNYLEVNADFDSDIETDCKGTVGHFLWHFEGSVRYDIYNVASGRLEVDEELKTNSEFYSTTPGATATAPAAAENTPAPADTPAQNTTTPPASNEYDDVPKTGEAPVSLVLLGVAVVCLAGSRALKRA